MRDYRAGALMQTLLRDPAAGLMHSLIYFSFLALFPSRWSSRFSTSCPRVEVPPRRRVRGLLVRRRPRRNACSWPAWCGRSYAATCSGRIGSGSRPSQRMRSSSARCSPSALRLPGEGARIALVGRPCFERWSFVGWAVSGPIRNWSHASLPATHRWLWILHVSTFVAFLVILPTTKLRHMFTSPLNLYLSDRQRPRGAMSAMPNLMETEFDSFGAGTVEDFTWKQLLDTDACTICGRCTIVCPAHATGKPLDPREIILKVGEVMAATGDPPTSPTVGTDPRSRVAPTCVRTRHPRGALGVHVVPGLRRGLPGRHRDLREDPRHASLPDAHGIGLPDRVGQRLSGHGEPVEPLRARTERPDRLGSDPARGCDGARRLEIFSHEYLYWVGCAGAFDDRNQKVTRAVATLLRRAGVDFAILGPSELCTGDPARRSGNEYLFQMLAAQNIETLDRLGVTKIIAQCPHCFNTMANEYPQLGGNYEVIHHTQLLEQLIAEGRLDVSGATLPERVTYHDACFLGRHNDVYQAPRRVVGSLGRRRGRGDATQRANAFCCGAGGARFWMEEHIGKKIGIERVQEALATGATQLAVACPFCQHHARRQPQGDRARRRTRSRRHRDAGPARPH